MLRVLVVDDETFIRKGLIAIIKREVNKEITFFEAENGFKALQVCRDEMPHLVISDIHMPGCDGLDFIRQLKQINDKQRVIVISGYENFQYAKEAIRLGVKEYVTKPIKKQEFIEIINKYTDDIEENKESVRKEVTARIKSKSMENQLKQDLFLQLLTGKGETERRFASKRLLDLEFLISQGRSQCGVIQYEISGSPSDYIDFAARNMIDEILAGQADVEPVITCSFQKGYVIVIFTQVREDIINESSRAALVECAKKIKRYCGAQVFVGVGSVEYELVNLYRSYQQAILALDFKVYGTGNYIQVNLDIKPEATLQDSVKHIITPLAEADETKLVQLFMELSSKAPSMKHIGQIHSIYAAIVNQVMKEVSNYELHENTRLDLPMEFTDIWDFYVLREEIRGFIKGAKRLLLEADGGIVNKKLLMDIIKYVDMNITENIDLNSIAHHFSKTPAYISILFKRAVHKGFSDYIIDKRIEIAKNLLADSNIPIGRVAQLCGYPNAKYFSVVFKKSSGTTPKEYRNNLY